MPCPGHGGSRFRGGILHTDARQTEAFDASPEHTLLSAIEQAGLQWPSSCRSGRCRTCLGSLAQGQVRYAMDWPGLSAEEKATGIVLPCVAYPLGDVLLRDPFED